MPRSALPAALVLCLLAACGSEAPPPAAPLSPGPTAYEIAGRERLEGKEPANGEGLRNVFRLSANVISGSEPEGAAALAEIAAMGVRTVLSVDGKVPEREAAQRVGLRYVHVPIRYGGITPDERLRIAKVFRELDGPFYVHCFHGKHRGPAAAALGRLVKDGASRERALAEMRQYAGTSEKYGGLYETIARGRIPTPAETRSYAWDFPAAHAFAGLRQAMVGISRCWDVLDGALRREFRPDPAHPDLDVGNEARMLAEHFEAALSMADVTAWSDDVRASMAESRELAEGLRHALRDVRREGGAGRLDDVRAAMAAVGQRCQACHAAHRNTRRLPVD